MRIWIDLANSPHPLIFAPIAARLVERGAELVVSVRDHAQTAELARERWPEAEIIGAPSPSGVAAKAAGALSRARALRSWARARRPDVALSHNSYAQLVAARSLRVPAVTAMDYEHQPANHLAFRCARRVLVPQAVPGAVLRRQGATRRKLVRYPGFKEEIYLGGFTPDPAVPGRLGVRDGEKLVVVRTSPAGAAYHQFENKTIADALRRVTAQHDIRCVVLARHPEQRRAIAELGLDVVMPEGAVDGRSLVWHADLFLGAGGTMSREAALMGVPVFSLFEGKPAAVDVALERLGLLRQLADVAALDFVAPRTSRSTEQLERLWSRGEALISLFVEETEAAGA